MYHTHCSTKIWATISTGSKILAPCHMAPAGRRQAPAPAGAAARPPPPLLLPDSKATGSVCNGQLDGRWRQHRHATDLVSKDAKCTMPIAICCTSSCVHMGHALDLTSIPEVGTFGPQCFPDAR